MNKQKTPHLLALIALWFGLAIVPLGASDHLFTDPILEDDFDFDLSAIEAAEAAEDGSMHRVVAAALVPTLGAAGVTNPIWKSLKPPRGRDTLYLMPQKITALEYGGVACSLFLNATREMAITAQSSINLDQLNTDGIATTLETEGIIAAGQKDFAKTQLDALLPLVKKFTLRDYKTGCFFQAGFNRGPFTVQLQTSYQLGLRHFWVPQHAQREIKAIAELVFPGSPPSDVSHYAYIAKAGLGDTRVKVGLNTLNAPWGTADVGVEAIIPTSLATSRKRIGFLPDFLVADDIGLKEALYSSLSNLRQYLLTPELGNGGHCGLGFYLESKLEAFSGLAQFWMRCSFDKFLPAPEDRLFLHQQTMTFDELILKLVAADLASSTAQYLRENVFPTPERVMVQPGGVFNFVLSAKIPLGKWAYCCGYDFFSQQREHITRVIERPTNWSYLRIEDSEQRLAVQHKLFSETSYTRRFRAWEATFSWGGDMTFAARNIGKDWTVFVKVSSSF